MKTYSTDAIILRRRDFAEADRIITLLTANKGKVVAIAKGARRITSKFSGTLELFRVANLSLVETKSFHIITESREIFRFRLLSSDLKRLSMAHYFAELIDRLVEEGKATQEIFQLLRESLIILNNQSDGLILRYFEMNLLALLGLKPELYLCNECEKKPQAKRGIFFSCKLGGLLCVSHRFADTQAFSISSKAVVLLRLLLERDATLLPKISKEPKVFREIKSVSDQFLRYQLDRDLLSTKFMKRVHAQFA